MKIIEWDEKLQTIYKQKYSVIDGMHGNYHNTTAVFEYTTKTEKQTENGKCVILILPLLKTRFYFH